MKKMNNNTHIEGYLYEHKLEKKVTGSTSKNPGTEYITGTISIATDDDLLNVVPVHFVYVTPTTTKGKPNANYPLLENILDGKIGTVMGVGIENAGKLRIDSSFALNEWYDRRDPSHPLVSQKRNEGGYIHPTQTFRAPNERATFDIDMLITNMRRIEADEENNQPEKGILKGCIFSYQGALLPFEVVVINSAGIDYFEGLEITSKKPVLTHLKGEQVSRTVVRTVTSESAFGEPYVREVRSSQRELVVNWASPEPYEWDSEDTLLASELTEKMADREVYLADLKQRQTVTQTAAAASAKKGYDF